MQALVDSVKLSTGQAQRIQIARALLRRPRLLFLDEAVSGLDTAAQQPLFRTFRALELTCLVVSHRPETLALTDRIIVFEHGRVVQQGVNFL
jgi:ABC-type bacteriocin/lantibiotic exporter with double-glycine peptidase domain